MSGSGIFTSERRRDRKLDGKIDAVFADRNVPQHPGAALLVTDHDEIVERNSSRDVWD